MAQSDDGMVGMTIAQQIAARFGNDGLCFESATGEPLQDMCDWLCSRRVTESDMTRWIFDDGSSIVVAADAWDLGLSPYCNCWAGADHGRHRYDCELL